jgi:8-oxo-dGTP pyrophosphatase MutT (NUDIX family)
MDAIPRRAARVLLVDGADRVLMFRGFDPARPTHRYWFTVGGGLEPDEPAAQGAARELAEETGLRRGADELGPPVWREITEYPFDGRWYRQEQDFFLVRVADWDVVTDGFDEIEQATIDGHRWWTIAELESTAERFYPTDLPGLLRRILSRAPAALSISEPQAISESQADRLGSESQADRLGSRAHADSLGSGAHAGRREGGVGC